MACAQSCRLVFGHNLAFTSSPPNSRSQERFSDLSSTERPDCFRVADPPRTGEWPHRSIVRQQFDHTGGYEEWSLFSDERLQSTRESLGFRADSPGTMPSVRDLN